jgi:hypothetical protein
MTKDIRDLNYYKLKAKELSKKKFEELCLKGKVQSEDYGTQLTVVAALLQHYARIRLEASAKQINVVPPPDVSKYLFNELNFVLWSMPQENPIPSQLYKKMLQLKSLRENHKSIPEEFELTEQETLVLQKALIWQRGNANFGIKIVGNIESGIPFGQDRLVLIWIITQCLKAGVPSVIGFKIKEFLDYFGIDTKGRVYDEVGERFERLKQASVTVWWVGESKRFELKCNYLDSVLIIRPKKGKDKSQDEVSMVTLNLSLWAHLAKENYVWLNPDVVRELKDTPGALDLYQWACAYHFKAKIKTIPLIELSLQMGMKDSQPYFKKKQSLQRWATKINKTVNKANLKGPGTNFTLEIQNGQLKKGKDLLIVRQSKDQIRS